MDNTNYSSESVFSLEAEQAVLGSILMDPACMPQVQVYLSADDFYLPQHRAIYTAIATIEASGGKIDPLIVLDSLIKDKVYDSAAGKNYLFQLSQCVPSTANVESYAKIVKEKFYIRSLINASKEIIEDASSQDQTADDLLEAAEQKIYNIRQGKKTNVPSKIGDIIVGEVYTTLQHLTSPEKDLYKGYPTGYSDLDRVLTGLHKSDLILIGARPAMGKTAFALSMAKNIAVDQKIPVAVFSLEMANVQLVNRLIVNVCEIKGETLKSGQLKPYEWNQLDYRIKQLTGAPLYLDDTPSLSVFELRTKARRLVREHGVRVIMIDYLQLMNASGMGFGSRQEEVSTISRSLKGLAKELNIPILALSQLNRGVENREGGDKRPQLSDLRESGAIEQDADIVMFLYRDDYYNPDSEKKNIAEVILAKHRAGSTGTVELLWMGNFTKFANWDKHRE